jgi:hypothetical protein
MKVRNDLNDIIGGLTERERFCLDAYLSNRNVELAWLCSREKPPQCKPEYIYKQANRWLNSAPCRAYLKANGIGISLTATEQADNAITSNRERKDIVRELNILADTSTGKQKADILLKLAEFEQMKSEEAPKEKKVTYYLPLKCNVCPYKPR